MPFLVDFWSFQQNPLLLREGLPYQKLSKSWHCQDWLASPPLPLPNPGTLVDLRAICTATPPKVYSAELNLGELNLTLV